MQLKTTGITTLQIKKGNVSKRCCSASLLERYRVALQNIKLSEVEKKKKKGPKVAGLNKVYHRLPEITAEQLRERMVDAYKTKNVEVDLPVGVNDFEYHQQNYISNLFKYLISQRRYKDVIEEWKKLNKKKSDSWVSTNIVVLTQVLQAMREDLSGAIAFYENLLKREDKNEIKLTSITHSVFLSILSMHGEYHHLIDAFNRAIERRRYDNNTLIYSIFVRVFVLNSDPKYRELGVVAFKRWFKIVNISSFCYGVKEVLNNVSLVTIEDLKEFEMVADSYNLVYLTQCLKLAIVKYSRPFERKFIQPVAEEKESEDIEQELDELHIDIRIGNAIGVEIDILKAIQEKNYNKASELFLQSKIIATRDNRVIFHMLLTRLAQEDFSNALDLFCTSIESGFVPWISSYNFMISEFGKRGWTDMAMYIFDEALTLKIENTVTYNCIIAMNHRNKDFEKCFHFYEELKRRGFTPDYFTYRPLVSICHYSRDFKRLNTIFKECRFIDFKTPAMNGLIFEMIYIVYAKANQFDAADEVAAEILERGLQTSSQFNYQRFLLSTKRRKSENNIQTENTTNNFKTENLFQNNVLENNIRAENLTQNNILTENNIQTNEDLFQNVKTVSNAKIEENLTQINNIQTEIITPNSIETENIVKTIENLFHNNNNAKIENMPQNVKNE